MWLLLLIVWKCGQRDRPHRAGPDVDKGPTCSRDYPQGVHGFKSVYGARGRYEGGFPRFHGNPQRFAGFGRWVMNSRPQCVKDGDGCGYPSQLCTAIRGRILVHRLSRGCAPVIHGLSTILWIRATPRRTEGGWTWRAIYSWPERPERFGRAETLAWVKILLSGR